MNIELCDSFNSIDTKMRCFRDRKVWDLDRRASGHNLLMHAPMCYAMQRLWSHQKCDANSSDEKLGRWQRRAAFENENLNLPDLRIPKEKKKLASKASTTTMTSTWEKACHGAVARQNGEALMESPFPPSFSVHFWNWGWLGLNNTQEKVVALSSGGSTGSGCGVSFMRCSVQARMACWSRQNRVFLLRGCYHVSMMLWISSLGMVFLSCSQANVSRSRAFPWLRLQVRNSTAFMILSAAC